MQQGTSTVTPPRHQGLQTGAVLMSPMMFASASTATAESTAEVARVTTPVHRPAFQTRQLEDLPPPYQEENEITPLTRAQMLQAFNYLLKVGQPFVFSWRVVG